MSLQHASAGTRDLSEAPENVSEVRAVVPRRCGCLLPGVGDCWVLSSPVGWVTHAPVLAGVLVSADPCVDEGADPSTVLRWGQTWV